MSYEITRMVAFVGFLVVVVAGIPLSLIGVRRLKQFHPETWRELGEPSFSWNMSPRNQVRLGLFMWSSRYRQLGDPVLDRVFAVSKGLTFLALVLFVLLWVVVARS